jgi:enoyl-CoA hydratase/carnithine racemase
MLSHQPPNSSNNKSLGMCHYLALTGKRLGAADLVHTGLATHYVPASRLKELHQALIDATSTISESTTKSTTKSAVRPIKDVVAPVLDSFHVVPQFPEPRHSFLAKHQDEIEQAFGSSSGITQRKTTVEDIMKALLALDTDFGRDTLSTMEKMSPTSMKITLEGMQRGALLDTIEECFRMEFRMGQGCLRPGSDFYEGVRAVLVDKDQSPKWNPDSVAEVSTETVESYFAPLPNPEDEWQPAPPSSSESLNSNL